MLSASVRADIHVYWLGQLIDATKAHCREKGIAQLYVHVVPSNEAAVKLYLANGFVQETEEKADFAYLRDRERRLLLRLAHCCTRASISLSTLNAAASAAALSSAAWRCAASRSSWRWRMTGS